MYLLHCAWIINYFLKLPQITVICLQVLSPQNSSIYTRFEYIDKKCKLLLEHFIFPKDKVTTFVESSNNAADFLHGHSLFTRIAYLADFSQ